MGAAGGYLEFFTKMLIFIIYNLLILSKISEDCKYYEQYFVSCSYFCYTEAVSSIRSLSMPMRHVIH